MVEVIEAVVLAAAAPEERPLAIALSEPCGLFDTERDALGGKANI
jgi:hypothetical protein